MSFCLLGVNHRSAPVEVRERLAIAESRISEVCRELAQRPGVKEAIAFSTCNRVELLANMQEESASLRSFVSHYFGIADAAISRCLYEYKNEDAVRHLFRVTSSLDSMIVGEPQILGQVKSSYAAARAVGALHSQLDMLLRRSFEVAKRVRNETAIGGTSVSVASVAVDLAKKIFGSLHGKKIYLVGAGKMTELAARYLVTQGASSIFVSNRTYESAAQLARKFGGEAIRFDHLHATADQADIVITSTGAPHAIFRREHGEAFLQRRRNRPMFFIDIAVPRDVAPEMNKLDGIFVYDIDDLQAVVSSNVAEREREAIKAEAIIEAEVERFRRTLETQDVVPTIVSLQEHLETVRQAEIERIRGRLGQLTPGQEKAVESLTRGIVNKILHTPMTVLKAASADKESAIFVEMVQRIFNLREQNKRETNEAKAAVEDAQKVSRG